MQKWKEELDRLRQQGMFRSLRTVSGAQGTHVVMDGRRVLLMCSNNYLGLADHPRLIEAAVEATRKSGVGSGASRLVSGTMEDHVELEQRLATFKGTEAALLFNSGYAANNGILQALFGADDIIFSDSLNHASIIDGCRLSKARTLVYPHGDVQALEALMIREVPTRKGRWVIVTDGVFSMDGDMAPLPELVRLKERFDALLMVDDAHGSGVLGAGGRGTAEELGCHGKVDLQMGTLGKALGSFGAYLAADRVVIDALINRARAFIFSTSLPPGVCASALAALEIIDSAEGLALRQRLRANRELFARRLFEGGCDTLGSVTQVVPVLTREPEKTMAITAHLLEKGVFIQGIRPPTVPLGLCRLRATVMATHEPQDLEQAAGWIVEALQN